MNYLRKKTSQNNDNEKKDNFLFNINIFWFQIETHKFYLINIRDISKPLELNYRDI